MKFLNSNYRSKGYNYANFSTDQVKNQEAIRARKAAIANAEDFPITQASSSVRYPTPSPAPPQNPPSPEAIKNLEKEVRRIESTQRSTKSDPPKRVRIREGANSNKLYRRGRVALKQAGKFVKNNKVGVGLAAAGALGAVGYGVYRKMRSDKGKKRGNYR